MTVLVTGGTGFIGSQLVKTLLIGGHDVRVAIRKSQSGQCAGASSSIVGDICATTDWGDALAGVDVIVHLAAHAHVRRKHQMEALAAFRDINVDGTIRLAKRAAVGNVRRLIFLSSVGVNGNESEEPFTEQDKPAPRDPYALSKMEAENGLCEISDQTGLEVVIIRPPLVYGPHAPGNFGALLRWVDRGLPLPFGSVTRNRRSLVALDNLVDLVTKCINHPKAAGETFLVSDGQDVSTAELLCLMGEVLGRSAWLLPIPERLLRTGALVLGKEEMARRLMGSLQIDASKARDTLGWMPPVTLQEGLRRAVTPVPG